jgi:hypothetical protein
VFTAARKGYNNKRYTQEVLINVCETISYCSNEKIGGAVLAVDMSKAFDTLSHKYVNEVFKFFGLGPKFKKMA